MFEPVTAQHGCDLAHRDEVSLDIGPLFEEPLDDGPVDEFAVEFADLVDRFGRPVVDDAGAAAAADVLAASQTAGPDAVRLSALAHVAPSGAVVSALSMIDPARLPADAALTWLQVLQRCQAWLAGLEATGLVAAAGRVRTVAEFEVPGADGETMRTVRIEDVVAEEVAVALRVAPRTARSRIDSARALIGPLAPLHAALLSGAVSTGHASAIAREAARLPRSLASLDPADGEAARGADDPVLVQQCAALLDRVLPFSATHTPGESARKARGLVEQVDPDAADRRRQQAKARIGVDVMDDVDGLSVLSACMTTVDAHAVLDAVRRLARDRRFRPDACTAGQRHVDALTALVLGAGASDGAAGQLADVIHDARVTAHVDVVVSIDTMLGLSNRPGMLVGCGPIAADAVRDLLATCDERSTMRRLVTDPDGALLDAGRTRYAVSDAQRAFLTTRDRTCRFPGCGVRATGCQVDHAIAWDDGGATDVANLGSLCSRHHNLKTHANWDIVESRDDGTCTWQSPRLRRYQRERADLLPVELLLEPEPIPF